jgi:hypothetical protein
VAAEFPVLASVWLWVCFWFPPLAVAVPPAPPVALLLTLTVEFPALETEASLLPPVAFPPADVELEEAVPPLAEETERAFDAD